MKFFLLTLFLQAPLFSAVIYREVDIRIGDATGGPFGSSSVQVDINDDFFNDWAIKIEVTQGSADLSITTRPTTRFVYRSPESILLNELVPFDRGEQIGLILANPDHRILDTTEAFATNLARFGTGSGSGGPFNEKTAYLGFEFEISGEAHFGYALLEDVSPFGATISAVAWESQPGQSILTGAIPEPSATALLILASAGFLARRTR